MERRELIHGYIHKCFNEPLFFAQEFLPHLLVNHVPDFHKEIYSLLKEEKRLVIAAPRGFAKSTLSSVIYPLWVAVAGLKKDVCIVSASETLAVEMLRKIKREIELNQNFIKYFGDIRTDKWSESHFVTTTGVTFRARGAGGQIRGFRPDLLILDDLETNESVESEDQRRKLKNWIFKDCFNTLMPEGQFVFIGTIDHPLSVLAEVLHLDNGWTKRKYTAYVDGIQEQGHELWPQLWNHERLQKRKKEIGTWAFASQYMNNPISDERAPIKPEQIKYWKELPSQMNMVLAVDPAYSEDEKADYKVATLVGIDQRDNRYLIQYVRTHDSIVDFMDAILNIWLQNKNSVTSIGIPNSGTEKCFFKSFLDHAGRRHLYPPVGEVKNYVAINSSTVRRKQDRIVATLQPLFEQGKYYIHEDHSDARDELLTIGSSKHDDVIDAMTYAEQLFIPGVGGFEKETKEYDHYGSPIEVNVGTANYGY